MVGETIRFPEQLHILPEGTSANITHLVRCNNTGRGFTQFKGGLHTEISQEMHINILELRAAREAIANLALKGDIIHLHVDNKIAVAYISKQGGTKSNALTWEACKLWETVQEKAEIFFHQILIFLILF